MRVLVIEDEPSLAQWTRMLLAEMGHAVDVEHSGGAGGALAFVHDYDGIVLDLSLPDRHGLSILQELRREGRLTPVLVVSGAGDTGTIVRALDAGADDYVVKPFLTEEFKARIRALLRRGGPRRSEVLVCANLVLNRLTRRALCDTVELALTPREFALLERLMVHAGEIVTRSTLLEKVWDMHFDPGSNVVDVHVARLRRKLRDAGAQPAVTAVRGVGFVLAAPRDLPATRPPVFVA
ncbi:MAG TPA: response regulator transcription factor [Gemmatimonadales bacterium]|nr:response regulator transcription factor [Gemmatimonadales bacterium]